jgi:small subunit ribosomal protein S20
MMASNFRDDLNTLETKMANHKSALKRHRQSEKRRLHNRMFRNRVRTFVKKARAQIAAGDPEAAKEAVRVAIRDLDMAASRGTIHKNNAARRKSRLMKQLAALEAQSK